MYLSAVEQRIKDSNIFEQVGTVTSFSQLKKKSIAKSTAAFVLPISEKLESQQSLGGVLEQRSFNTFAVIVAVKNRQDKDGEKGSVQLEGLRQQLRDLIYGWSPAVGYDPILLGDGRLLALQEYTVFWQDQFNTAHCATGNYQN